MTRIAEGSSMVEGINGHSVYCGVLARKKHVYSNLFLQPFSAGVV